MNYLLDTHSFLWFITADNKLSEKAKETIEDLDTKVYVSLISFWEIAIKIKIGKLEIKYEFSELFNEALKSDIAILPLEKSDLIQLDLLDLIHSDPFDRMIIAQAISNDLMVITKEVVFKLYPIKVLW